MSDYFNSLLNKKKDYQLFSPPDSPFCEFHLRNAKYFTSLAKTMVEQI